jgi:hypothetical protein
VILPVTFHNDTKSTGQSRSAPPAEFRTLLHSVKTPTAHWVFLAVLLGTNTFEISAISSSDIVGKRLSGFLVHRFFFFGERKSWSSMTTALSDVPLRCRSDETTLSDVPLRHARGSPVYKLPVARLLAGLPRVCAQ